MLHRVLKERFAFRNGVYFEAGANDGLDQSNTAYLERYYGWRGVLVEAIPHKYVQCRLNRPRSRTVHACLVSGGDAQDYVEMKYADLMSVSASSVLNQDEHVESARKFIGLEQGLVGERFLAPAKTVSQIFDECGLSVVDLFSLDVEGAELDVLSGIDFTRHRPRTFLIETEDPVSLTRILARADYLPLGQVSQHDFLFVEGGKARSTSG
jgi:FkbM family methyltransferase